LSRSYLIENTSSYGTEVATRSLDTHIKNIRKKLGKKGLLIETVPKFGYRFKAAHA
jgi:two-component system phosphate regulon response regulator PhoB